MASSLIYIKQISFFFFFLFFFSRVNCTRVPSNLRFFFWSQSALPFLCLLPPDHKLVAWLVHSGWAPSSCRCYPVRDPHIYFMEDRVGDFWKFLVENVVGTFIHLECLVLTPG